MSSCHHQSPEKKRKGIRTPEGVYRKTGEELLIRAGSDRMRGGSFKLEEI